MYAIYISVVSANTQMNLSYNNYVCKPIWLSPIHKYYPTYNIGYLDIIVVIGHGGNVFGLHTIFHIRYNFSKLVS